MSDLIRRNLVLNDCAALAACALLLACHPAQAQDLPFGCPKADAVPYFDPIELTAGFTPDPFTFEHDWILGGTNLQTCGFEESGFVDQRPDLELHWEGEAPQLVISMESDADTVLLIHDPADHWLFNDNGQDQNPKVVIENPAPGAYAIFVGVAEPIQNFQGMLRISQAGP